MICSCDFASLSCRASLSSTAPQWAQRVAHLLWEQCACFSNRLFSASMYAGSLGTVTYGLKYLSDSIILVYHLSLSTCCE